MPSPLRVCLVASEVAPFAKTGGLGDVVAALGRYLHAHGHDARVFVPRYGNLRPSGQAFTPVGFIRDVPVRMGDRVYSFSASSAPLPGTDFPVYFVECDPLYAHRGIYTSDADEPVRFALLTRAALECCQRMGWGPQVLHVHDWHTSLGPVYRKTLYGWDRLFHATRTVLTIHNLAYQGTFPARVLHDVGLAAHAGLFRAERLARGAVGFLETGILHADAVTAVSETYAREIQTPEHGFGLDALLRARSGSVVGIVNGIDAKEWDPATDPRIPARYTVDDLSGKLLCKRRLLEALDLRFDPSVPLLGIVSRLTAQKGFDLVFRALPRFLREQDLRLVALGTGSPALEEGFRALERAFPAKVRFLSAYSEETAHRIEAGADLFLMPSLFEPCGLNQMYSQRYGTLPVVHRTGGLADTVRAWDPRTGEGTGFVFDHHTPEGLAWALSVGLAAWRDPAARVRLIRNAMSVDFSWDRQVQRYVALYRRLLAL